ncbi:MAG: quinol dehydrogenase ferredoxin subunit NapH [Magnetospirillum sp.]|nr:quinol dehydrogenase ferredoxin subunit NapH [Magnetospirillum sp.]
MSKGVKWLLIRRASQLGFLALFLVGPLTGMWIVKGTLASSLTLGVLPLTDPLMVLQSLLARHVPEATALLGAALVLIAYALLGGRLYCSFVCPLNMVTDFAAWLRRRLGLKEGLGLDRRLRYWALGGVLVAAAATGTIAWEFVNPVTILHRGLVTGGILTGGAALLVTAAIFLFDLGVSGNAWCGHLCPVGAFYALVGERSLIRVVAQGRDACNDCMDCFTVCPERQVIAPALRGAAKGVGPVILSRDCTNCGRCIDVCSKDVFNFGLRFRNEQLARGVTAVKTKIIAIAIAVCLGFAGITGATAADVKGLRGSSPDTVDKASATFKVMEGTKHARYFRDQPPLVPHAVEKYDIDLELNHCLRCHEWPNSDKERAPKLSDNHYMDRNGVKQDRVNGNRYFCTQCHVSQVEAQPLVESTFKPVTMTR